MPLKPSQILHQLYAKQADFTSFDQDTLYLLQKYHDAVTHTARQTAAEVTEQLHTRSLENPGATPLEPWTTATRWVIPFGQQWPSREASLSWVRDRLTGISTFAVDGSQIFPSKDLSIPIALVQVGWYENRHLPSGRYEKDIDLDVMTPVDLQVGDGEEMRDRRVNMRRFQMETQRLIQYMRDHAHADNCLVFFDGSLIVTFAEAFDLEIRSFYLQCVVDLLRASEDYQIPLVGYIDTSYARDLTVMLQGLHTLPEARMLHDAQLVNRGMQWGDRTPLFRCDRSGILSHYQDQSHRLGFTYTKMHDGPPVRLEFPLWLYEDNRLEQVLDWIRGEVIIGSGYPYVIETADQTAVLQMSDRQAFYRIVQDWATQANLDLRLSRKMVSKARRR
ncbi:MAG: DNA double-strand break repair nuclease NurA [Cyanobacteria bacterium]|nr:DNA double-strand break repair nuclease NurA [Cyanobacteriota bacterium]MDW8201818.1 DNA double-strand break repair nuclease NurA [Cyanobacteriota bacterium SKYGB_h_bin112]